MPAAADCDLLRSGVLGEAVRFRWNLAWHGSVREAVQHFKHDTPPFNERLYVTTFANASIS